MLKTFNKIIGNKGEDIASIFLGQNGFEVVVRNYRKNWGELDIVARKDNVTHFFEVKSVTSKYYGHRPEENVDGFKVRQIRRMISTYLSENGRGVEEEFKFHVICVYMNMESRRARVKWIKDVIL